MPSLRSTRSHHSNKSAADSQDDFENEEVEHLEKVEMEDDEGEQIDEEEAETRCLCGQIDPPDEGGLYIECEKCKVWQHGYCVSIGEFDLPEKYWCEKCRPDLHKIIITSEGRMSRYLPCAKPESTSSSSKRSRKRTVSQNQQYADDEDDEEERQKKRKERATYNSREDARYEALIQRVMEESKREVQTENGSGDDDHNTNSNGSSGRNSRSSRRRGASNDQEDNTASPSTNSKTHAHQSDKEDGVKKEKESDANDSTAAGNTTSASKAKKPTKRPRKSAPSKPKVEKDATSIDFNKPTRPRFPQQRATINEMSRRVAAILEFIGRTQVDIANEQKEEEELSKFVEDEESKKNISALFKNYNGSLALMDGLTRKLLLWEEKFGPENHR